MVLMDVVLIKRQEISTARTQFLVRRSLRGFHYLRTRVVSPQNIKTVLYTAVNYNYFMIAS